MQVNQEDRIAPQEKSANTNTLAIVAVAVAALIAGGAYYYLNSDEPTPIPEPLPLQIPEMTPDEPIEIIAAIPEPEIVEVTQAEVVEIDPLPQVEPLPSLSESDGYVHNKTVVMADGMKIEPLLVEENLVRHFVVFIDNLAQGELARKVSPLKAPNRSFTVSDITNKTYLNPDSYHRYDLYADFITHLDEQQLAATYKDLTPLLAEAFEELGYSKISFNERMLEAIDVMLAAPIIEQPIELDGISVNYQFVDPQLEALPNAQKLLVRMGPENTKKVKAALRKLKKHLDN
ncbi:DUF3014 domain-containing protein [Shewanella eurypsychrophilus]|uniref:DUF3014 domain-containing protein n=1 Tax=Shewanella eurypsychrophilus TaxID=2593656 RepID=A0ABX6VBE8_9GAMM|nr:MULTISPECIES: DUF3014 domain-containing protein [Shewanella]QFU24820.1 DUF3014 domain-containing protein [Shewanella sp. YLB-09]QPG60010.1 DUF3014 domain-containing protein [Shewanella eurypsychrophilus]